MREQKNHKNHHERDFQSRRGAIFGDPGNELFIITKEAKAFYLHPKRGEKLGELWYSLEPVGVNYLGSMLSRISKEAGTSVVYTNHCIRSTTIQKLARGGHGSQRNHVCQQTQVLEFSPELLGTFSGEQRSNLLCASQENMRPSEVSSAVSPAKWQRSHMDFMDSCFNNCNFHGSMQFNFY